MMELWVNSSKDEISVNAKYNAENEKECNEVSDKIQQCISWWNCSDAIWDQRGIPFDNIPTVHIKDKDTSADPLTNYERSQAALYERLRTALYGTKIESST